MDPQKVKIGLRIGLVLLGVAALVSAGAVLAQISIPATEPGGEVTEISNSFDSYLDAGIVVPENGLAASGESFAWPEGLAPDDNPPEGTARTQGTQASTQTFHYFQVSGATLRGRSSSTGYAYDAVGCTHVTSGTGIGRILNTELILPDEAIIKYLRLYYRDTEPTKVVRGFITRYDPGIATLDLISVGSTAAFVGGYGFVVSPEITETVNNTRYAYTLIGWPDDVGATLQICGLRVAYYLPQNNFSFLPAVKSH